MQILTLFYLKRKRKGKEEDIFEEQSECSIDIPLSLLQSNVTLQPLVMALVFAQMMVLALVIQILMETLVTVGSLF